MKKLWLVFIAALLAGCQMSSETATNTPAPSVEPLSGTPIPVTLSELAAKPAFFEGAFIQLTGAYTPLPLLVCKSKRQAPPASWGLSSNGLMALAGGVDEQLRPLLPENLMMTIAGRWQHWRGPVGCGASAQVEDLWYLEVSHIISPNPIAMVTLTPGSLPVDTFNEPPPTGETAVSPTPFIEPPAEATAVPLPTPPVNAPPTFPPSPTPSVRATTLPTATPTSTATTANTPAPDKETTPTPTAEGQLTLTLTPTSTPTPTASATPNPNATIAPTNTPVFTDILEPEEPVFSLLNANDRHQWEFSNEMPGNTLSLSVVSGSDVDIALSIFAPDGAQLVADQNNVGAGEIERVTGLNMAQTGSYLIDVYAANNAAGNYAILALDDLSFPISFDLTAYNTSVTTEIDENSEQLWFFNGSLGDVITITAVPDSNGDIGIDLLGPDGAILETIDEFFDGETEELTDYQLSASGLYALWLYGFSDSSFDTTFIITNN